MDNQTQIWIERTWKIIQREFGHSFGQCHNINLRILSLYHPNSWFSISLVGGKCSLVVRENTFTVTHTWLRLTERNENYILDMGIHRQEAFTITLDQPILEKMGEPTIAEGKLYFPVDRHSFILVYQPI